MIKKTLFLLMVVAGFNSCKHTFTVDKLYGRWDYIKIDHPKADDLTDTISNAELKANAPYINFAKMAN